MPWIKVTKKFPFAHDGIRVEVFEPSDEPVQVSDRCAEVALENEWAEEAKAPKGGKAETGSEDNGPKFSVDSARDLAESKLTAEQIAGIKGSAKDGSITKKDVEAAIAALEPKE